MCSYVIEVTKSESDIIFSKDIYNYIKELNTLIILLMIYCKLHNCKSAKYITDYKSIK